MVSGWSQTCSCSRRKPYLTKLQFGNARLDIRAEGFWGERPQDAFADMRVFNPHSTVSPHQRPATGNMRKKRGENTYKEKIHEVEHGSFTPLVFSATCGMGVAAEIFYEHLASLISGRNDQHYGTTMSWIRFYISFSLIRSAVLCLKGSRLS